MKDFLLCIVLIMVLIGCTKQEKNPFLSEFQTPFRVPPFDVIEIKHYVPAFEEGMRLQRLEIEAITGSQDEPTFQNTLEALEGSGAALNLMGQIFPSSRFTGYDLSPEAISTAKVRTRTLPALLMPCSRWPDPLS